MLFVPLPFVVTLLLVILLVQLLRRETEQKSNRIFISLLVLYALLSVLIGTRWGYGVRLLLPLQSVLAASWASLAWLGFRQLTNDGPDILFSRDWVHAIPSGVVLALILFWPDPIDVVLIAIYLGYGFALLRVASSGSDNLSMVRFDESPRAHKALLITAIILIVFALVDIVISLDIRFLGGHYSSLIVSVANLPALIVLGGAAAIADKAKVREVNTDKELSVASSVEPEDIDVLNKVEVMLITKSIFRDFDLTLDRLARRCGISARKISGAVNRIKGQNVSQYVNEFRVAEVCRLLIASDQPITTVMFDAGFQTKSNFNREFRRVAGISPKAWRSLYPNVEYNPGL
ncbi:MAG: AraC family transcriptional regulator [Halopseudomonas aestusnigri]